MIMEGTRMKKVKENGRSMVEILGVLAIIGVLSVGGLAGYSKAMKKNKLNKTEDEIVQIMTNLRTLFATSGNVFTFGEEELENAIKADVFPKHMVVSLEKLQNLYKGEVKLSVVKIDGMSTFKLTYEGLPKDAALTMATVHWGDETTGMLHIIINEDRYGY